MKIMRKIFIIKRPLKKEITSNSFKKIDYKKKKY